MGAEEAPAERRGREDALVGDVVFPLERKGVLLKLRQPLAAVSAAEERSRGACACACAGKRGERGLLGRRAALTHLLLVAATALQGVCRKRDVRARQSHEALGVNGLNGFVEPW